MPQVGKKYYDPKALARIGNLEIVAKLVVEGFVSGLHRSPFKGASVEFAEHRQYTAGDEIRHIDWRVYARSDRFYIKQFEEETNLRAYILVDASGSMAYSSEELGKFEYACFLASSLSYLMLQQQDSVGLVLFDREVKSYIAPRATPTHFRTIVSTLEETEPGGETALSVILHDLAERIKRRGLIILISDLFDDIRKLLGGLQHFRHKKHEVIVMQVMDPHERTFPFRNWTMFEGLEGARRILTDPQMVRQQYLEELEKFVTELRRGCHQRRIDLCELDTSTPYDVALARYLARRLGKV